MSMQLFERFVYADILKSLYMKNDHMWGFQEQWKHCEPSWARTGTEEAQAHRSHKLQDVSTKHGGLIKF
ncbi:hypothetical protein T07_3530 [Trichinella nelsoni]|uniref:Uncharacterized protein n=1 Tax=Trichinella nelsoni TaxID=6336 RepID=A0A0V0RYY0_9BILA|nr:hypothetical protein T07_3530 [Trichinella nelsoni]